jgi:D-alanine-D-alanine ligase
MNIAAFLDLLGKPYTGAGPHALYLAQDKALAKKIFAFHQIRTPFFATSYKGKLDHSHDIAFPLIVKPCSEDGSIGIDMGSVVSSVKELMERIHYIHEEFDSPALIEEYIEGREIYAAVLGNENPEVLPMVELDLSKLPKGTPKIAGKEVKWEKETEAYKVTKSAIAEDLEESTVKRLSETALSAYQALKLRDYGRIDMRLTKKGEVFVIEANPNPWLASTAEFAIAAKKAGRSYTQLIGEILDLARGRYMSG